jgi:hypothetical protein
MQKINKLIAILFVALSPLAFMAYGWYLGQLHQSGYDVAGIILFVTGAAGLILAVVLHLSTRKYSWYNSWFANLLTGLASCGIVFALLLLFARLHG